MRYSIYSVSDYCRNSHLNGYRNSYSEFMTFPIIRKGIHLKALQTIEIY